MSFDTKCFHFEKDYDHWVSNFHIEEDPHLVSPENLHSKKTRNGICLRFTTRVEFWHPWFASKCGRLSAECESQFTTPQRAVPRLAKFSHYYTGAEERQTLPQDTNWSPVSACPVEDFSVLRRPYTFANVLDIAAEMRLVWTPACPVEEFSALRLSYAARGFASWPNCSLLKVLVCRGAKWTPKPYIVPLCVFPKHLGVFNKSRKISCFE